MGATLRELANRFLTWKRQLVDNRELPKRTFVEYHATCLRILTTFGKERAAADLAANDFERMRTKVAMAVGERKSEQQGWWIATTELPISPGHPFYTVRGMDWHISPARSASEEKGTSSLALRAGMCQTRPRGVYQKLNLVLHVVDLGSDLVLAATITPAHPSDAET